MSTRGKYITGEVISPDGFDIGAAICFSEYVTHASVAPLFSEIWGAGFFSIGDTVTAYGGSVGIQVESRGEKDATLIRRALGIRE